jgi:hypothetical protein
MKNFILASLIFASASTLVGASEIVLSKAIPSGLRDKIEKDLAVLDNFKFSPTAPERTLQVMGLSSLNSQTASEWLNERVNYVVAEKALSLFNLLFNRNISIERTNVDFPNPLEIPYSSDFNSAVLIPKANTLASEKTFTVMSNIGSALYMGGKNKKVIFGMKVSRGLFRSAERVSIISPRAGIIQIGEGLFAPELTVNKDNPDAMVNSIFRLATFFHEARHSDGNGKSLSFSHAICPKGHEYADEAACDENLNGPYTVGAQMMLEMARGCEENCSEKEKEILKVLILDDASRVLKITHKGEVATDWDATPESL